MQMIPGVEPKEPKEPKEPAEGQTKEGLSGSPSLLHDFHFRGTTLRGRSALLPGSRFCRGVHH